MTDLAFGLQKALYDALSSGVTLAEVYQEAPEDAEAPFVIIGDDTIEDLGTKDSRLERHSVTITVVTDLQGKKRMREIQEQIRATLERQPISAAGCLFGNPQIASGDSGRLEDQLTYVGRQTVVTIAQPA